MFLLLVDPVDNLLRLVAPQRAVRHFLGTKPIGRANWCCNSLNFVAPPMRRLARVGSPILVAAACSAGVPLLRCIHSGATQDRGSWKFRSVHLAEYNCWADAKLIDAIKHAKDIDIDRDAGKRPPRENCPSSKQQLRTGHGLPVIIDSQGSHLLAFEGLSIILCLRISFGCCG